MANVERLIELVKQYPILYDWSDENYQNSRKKDKIWTEIGVKLHENGADMKRKFKNLRDTFSKHIRLTKTTTGQPAYRGREWQWAKQMEAFRPYFKFADTSYNVHDIEAQTDSDHMKKESTSDFDLELDNIPNAINVATRQSSASPKVPTSPSVRKRARSDLQSPVSDVVNYFEEAEKVEHDATELLFLAYAKTIKQFSRKRQALTKFKIAQIIMEEEISHIAETSDINVP